jgi:hypothetical protein
VASDNAHVKIVYSHIFVVVRESGKFCENKEIFVQENEFGTKTKKKEEEQGA